MASPEGPQRGQTLQSPGCPTLGQAAERDDPKGVAIESTQHPKGFKASEESQSQP